MASCDFKVGARILVVGYNGSGKSSLINKLANNDDLTKVGDSLLPTQHEAAAIGLDHHLQIQANENAEDGGPINQLIMLFDTQGFGGTTSDDRQIAESIVGIVKTADVVLICHKLYQRVDGKVAEELKELVRILGSKLMKKAIFVFTCGDEYIIRCRPKPVADLTNDDITRQMRAQAEGMKQNIVKILTSLGISQEIGDNIPYCITSADQDDLPTGNWINDL
uniref:G domain-containing protein n=1 Tax=Amphimedon queenslandica TaxID=400682 RepID=A0A1X7UGN1_AMPQE